MAQCWRFKIMSSASSLLWLRTPWQYHNVADGLVVLCNRESNSKMERETCRREQQPYSQPVSQQLQSLKHKAVSSETTQAIENRSR